MTRVPEVTNNLVPAAGLKMNELLPTADQMDAGIIAPTSTKFLPFLEMCFPIMATPRKPWYEGHNYEIGFVQGSDFIPLPKDTVLTVLDKRNAAKKKLSDDETEYAYDSVIRAGKEFAASKEKFQQFLVESKTNKDVNIGYSFVVAAIFPDGRIVILDFSAFKTIAPYMYGPLSPAIMAKKVGLKILIDNHKGNLREAKTGNFYPDAKAFQQWEHVDLTVSRLKAIYEALKNVEEAYMTWINR